MDAKKPDFTSPEYAAWRDDLTKKIKERSAKPTSQLRKEYAEQTIARHTLAVSQDTADGRWIKDKYQGDPARYFLSYYLAHPQLGVNTLDDYYKHHEVEDRRKDQNMITSVDLLDLHLSYCADFEQAKRAGYDPSHHTLNTNRLLSKVTKGLLWALDFEEEREKRLNPQGGYGFSYWKEKLTQAVTSRVYKEQIIVIDNILGSVHANDTGGDPLAANHLVRDLLFERRDEAQSLLKLLANP